MRSIPLNVTVKEEPENTKFLYPESVSVITEAMSSNRLKVEVTPKKIKRARMTNYTIEQREC